MAGWANIVIAISALTTAVAVLWRLVIKPFFKLLRLVEQLLPLMVNLIDSMGDTRVPFSVLNEIIAQFRSNAGSTLRDAVNRLEKATGDLSAMSANAQSLATADRQRVAGMVVQLEDLNAWRRARQSEQVVEQLAAQAVTDRQVASDLAAATVLNNQAAIDAAAAKVIVDDSERGSAHP